MNDEPIAELDQFGAFSRDLMAANQLELIEVTNLDPEWIAEHTAADLLDAFLLTAAAICKDGGLQALIATELPPVSPMAGPPSGIERGRGDRISTRRSLIAC